MNIPPTHIDRTVTNDDVYIKASEHAVKPIYKFSEIWLNTKFKLLGHLLRAAPGDPMREVTFEKDTIHPRLVKQRRPGRPRDHWLLSTMTEAWDEIVDNENIHFDITSETDLAALKDHATQRLGIFETKPFLEPYKIFGIANEDLF